MLPKPKWKRNDNKKSCHISPAIVEKKECRLWVFVVAIEESSSAMMGIAHLKSWPHEISLAFILAKVMELRHCYIGRDMTAARSMEQNLIMSKEEGKIM